MYEAFYGLREKPFALTPDPKYLYPSRSHREALDHLLYGIQEREGFIVITGDVGTGKTTLCRAIFTRLDPTTKTALVLNPVLSEEELLRTVLHDFGLPGAGTTKKALVDELNAFLLTTLAEGHRAVLMIDESQTLSPALLEQVRLLSNLETEHEKLIQIILLGQLGLLDMLASPELKQLNQRVSVRYQLEPISYQETCQYIYHRLMVAGGASGVTIAPSALRAIYRFSAGIPRLINLACDRALLKGFTDQSTNITGRRARQAISSLSDLVSVGPAGRRPRRLLPLVAAVVAAVAFGGGWLAARAWTSVPVPAVPPRPAALVPDAGSAESGALFTLLVGAYPNEPQAREVERRLAARGYSSFVAVRASQGGGTNYGVLVGRFSKVDAARQTQARLTDEEGFSEVTIVRFVDKPEGGGGP